MEDEMFYQETDRYVKLTREELYEQVWTIPTVQLSKTYGISDVYLARLCRVHKIPKPPVGYWARRQHGYKTSTKPLPKLDSTELQFVYIPKRSIPEKMVEQPAEVEQRIAFEKGEANRILVSECLENPTPTIERTQRSLESAAADEKGIVRPRAKGCLDVAVGKPSIGRAMRIMDALLKALETRGYLVTLLDEERGRVSLVTILDEQLAFSLDEELEREERPLTVEQKRDLAKWGHYYGRNYDYSLTGKLCR